MKEYSFLEGEPNAGYQEIFDRGLFHEREHLLLQSPKGYANFYIVRHSSKQVLGFLPVHVDGAIARSPASSPYGSIVFTDSLPPEVLYDFLEFVEQNLKQNGVEQIWIKNPPVAYNSDLLNLLQVIMLNLGFVVDSAEVGAVIRIDNQPFEHKIRLSQQQKLKACRAEGAMFDQISIDSWEEVYDFISRCYLAKGRTTSMTKDRLQEFVNTFQNRFLFYLVRKQETTLAAAISIRVTDKILYNFYLAHDEAFSSLSPVLLLLDGLYGYCQTMAIDILDLGTSALEGKPNFSLLDFKRRTGAAYTSKLSFVKKL